MRTLDLQPKHIYRLIFAKHNKFIWKTGLPNETFGTFILGETLFVVDEPHRSGDGFGCHVLGCDREIYGWIELDEPIENIFEEITE